MGVRKFLAEPLVWATGFAFAAVFLYYKQWKKDIVEEIQKPVPAVVEDFDDSIDETSSEKQLLKATCNIEDFNCIAVLGRGSYGKVMLAEYRRTKEMFAIKAIKKRDTVTCGSVDRLKCEQRVLEVVASARHPFLVNMFASFQTEQHACFVMEYAAGGDLLTHSMAGPFSEPRTVFYSACAVLGIQFLHEHNIAHRDIKLANMLLDSEGYLKIADFGFCKEEMAFRDRTCSRIGTTDYIAPEMLMDKSYTRATDWWALGVTVFEMLVGETPFYACDDLETHHNILSQDVEFPTFLSDEAVLFIRKLLCKRPKRRLGSGERDALEVREQPFFREMDWNGLLAREIRPPFVPTIQGCYDVSNFEDEFTMETPALTPPLDPTALSLGEQELFSGFNYTGDWAMSSMPSASLKVHTH